MKFTTVIVAILSTALIAAECSAEPPGRQRGQKGERGMARGQNGAAQRDPAEMAKKMMTEFDKDGDSKLNARELVAMLTAMQERRAAAGQPAADGKRRGSEQKPSGAGTGKGAGNAGKKGQRGKGKENSPVGGGLRPKRPSAD